MNGQEYQTAFEKVRAAGAATWLAVALTSGAVAIAGWQGVLLFKAILTPTPKPIADPGKTEKQIEQYAAMLDGSVKQADGRTLFILPINPKAAAEAPVQEVAEVPKEPPTPTTYGGPGVIAFINGTVWFDNGAQLSTGEERDGVSVVGMSPPWDARLRWRGVEFTVPLFEKDRLVAPKSKTPAEEKLGTLGPTPVAKPPESRGPETRSQTPTETPPTAPPSGDTPKSSPPAAEPVKPDAEPSKPDAPKS